MDISFNDKELTELNTSGKYELQSYDLLAIEEDYLLFWERVIPITGLSESEFHSIREKFGLRKDRLEGDRIFTPSKKGLNRIDISFGSDAKPSEVGGREKEIVKEMALHANYLGADIKKLVITSTKRTEEKQAKLMVSYLKDETKTMYPTVRGWLYTDKQKDGNTYREQWDEGIITESQFEDIAEKLAYKHVMSNKNDYGHVLERNTVVFDIGPGGSEHSSKDKESFNKSIALLEGKTLDNRSKLYGEGGEEAYHIVVPK